MFRSIVRRSATANTMYIDTSVSRMTDGTNVTISKADIAIPAQRKIFDIFASIRISDKKTIVPRDQIAKYIARLEMDVIHAELKRRSTARGAYRNAPIRSGTARCIDIEVDNNRIRLRIGIR